MGASSSTSVKPPTIVASQNVVQSNSLNADNAVVTSSPAPPAIPTSTPTPTITTRPYLPGPTFFGYKNPVSDELILQWAVGVVGVVCMCEAGLAFTKVGKSQQVQRAFPIWSRRLPIYTITAACGWIFNQYCLPPPIPVRSIREMRAKQEAERRAKAEAQIAERRKDQD